MMELPGWKQCGGVFVWMSLAIVLSFSLASHLSADQRPEIEASKGLSISLPWGVLYTSPSAEQNRPHPLTIDLIREGEAFASHGWAYTPITPGLDHPVRVISAEVNESRINLTCQIHIPHQLPFALGGSANYEITLNRIDEENWRGTYRGQIETFAAQDPEKRKVLWASLGFAGEPDFRHGLRSGEVRSFEHVADQSRVGPIVASAVATSHPATSANLRSAVWLPAKNHESKTEADDLINQIIQPRPERLRQISIEPRADMPTLARTRDLYRLILWYEQTRGQHADPERRQIESVLRHGLDQLTGIAQPPSASPFHAEAIYADLVGPEDHRLAFGRAIAGLAALAIHDAGVLSDSDQQKALAIVNRSLHRWALHAIGESGATHGQGGFPETFAMVRLYLHAAEKAGLAHGVSLDRLSTVARWQSYDQSTSSTKSPLVRLADLLHPLRQNAPDPDEISHLRFDEQTGVYLINSPDNALQIKFHLGRGPDPAVVSRGVFSIIREGENWTPSPAANEKAMGWPELTSLATVRVDESPTGFQKPAYPTGPGYLGRIRTSRDGLFTSISMHAPGYREDNARENHPVLEGSGHYRTLGVDFSKRSGADALILVIDSMPGLGERRRAWQLSVGDLPADQMTIRGNRFVIQPSGKTHKITGTVLYPTDFAIEYVPPSKGISGRIEVITPTPQKNERPQFAPGLDRRPTAPLDDFGIPDDLDIPLEGQAAVNSKEQNRHKADAQRIEKFLLRHTSSITMGGGDRGPKAKSSMVILLAIHKNTAPNVKVVADEQSDQFLQIGQQLVEYEEWLIKWGAASR